MLPGYAQEGQNIFSLFFFSKALQSLITPGNEVYYHIFRMGENILYPIEQIDYRLVKMPCFFDCSVVP
jgi:hypothetical protein